MIAALTKFIPPQYRWIAWLVAAAALFAGGFYTCHQFSKADQVDEARAETQQVIKQTEVSDAVAVKHEAVQAQVRTVFKTIIKEVPKYVTVEADAVCPIPNSFVSVWNAASAGAVPDPAAGVDDSPSAVRLSGVAEQHVADAGQYYEIAARLSALQDWVLEQQKVGR